MENEPHIETVFNESDGDYSYSVDHPQKCVLDVGVMHNLAGQLYRMDNATSLDFQIVDARGKDRFDGTVPEPRAGLRSGSIKNSINFRFN